MASLFVCITNQSLIFFIYMFFSRLSVEETQTAVKRSIGRKKTSTDCCITRGLCSQDWSMTNICLQYVAKQRDRYNHLQLLYLADFILESSLQLGDFYVEINWDFQSWGNLIFVALADTLRDLVSRHFVLQYVTK